MKGDEPQEFYAVRWGLMLGKEKVQIINPANKGSNESERFRATCMSNPHFKFIRQWVKKTRRLHANNGGPAHCLAPLSKTNVVSSDKITSRGPHLSTRTHHSWYHDTCRSHPTHLLLNFHSSPNYSNSYHPNRKNKSFSLVI